MKHWRCAILGLWIALTCSVQAIGGIQGLVLCLSSQGHIAIESAHDLSPALMHARPLMRLPALQNSLMFTWILAASMCRSDRSTCGSTVEVNR